MSSLNGPGDTFGVRAIHAWHVRAADDGTIVTTEESWDGLPARLFRGRSKGTLDASIASGLALLKAEAERQAALASP